MILPFFNFILTCSVTTRTGAGGNVNLNSSTPTLNTKTVFQQVLPDLQALCVSASAVRLPDAHGSVARRRGLGSCTFRPKHEHETEACAAQALTSPEHVIKLLQGAIKAREEGIVAGAGETGSVRA